MSYVIIDSLALVEVTLASYDFINWLPWFALTLKHFICCSFAVDFTENSFRCWLFPLLRLTLFYCCLHFAKLG